MHHLHTLYLIVVIDISEKMGDVDLRPADRGGTIQVRPKLTISGIHGAGGWLSHEEKVRHQLEISWVEQECIFIKYRSNFFFLQKQLFLISFHILCYFQH